MTCIGASELQAFFFRALTGHIVYNLTGVLGTYLRLRVLRR